MTALSASTTLRLLLQFLMLPVLSRLLEPADFGLAAMAMPFIVFAQLISDAGLGQSLIRIDGEEKATWSTAFWLLVGTGAIIAVCLAGIAPLVAWIYHEPRLRPIIMTLALVALMQSLA